MRISFVISRMSGLSLSLMLSFVAFTMQPFAIINTAKAESNNYGSSFAGKRVRAPSAIRNKVGIARSGVRFGNSRQYNRNARHHYNRNANNNYRVIKRQRDIASRNLRVQNQNELRSLRASTRRTSPNGRFVPQQERVSLLDNNVIDSEFVSTNQGSAIASTQACPRGHNCGYRLYGDSTGPRIITPGVSLNNNLPNFDGVNGPKIIRLD